MTTEAETDITTTDELKTRLKGILERAQVSEPEKLQVLQALGTPSRSGGPTAGGAGTPGAKQTPEEAKAQREREEQQAKAAQR